jgi:predicted Zn-ribbon and HTH transcriptional regulator
MSDNSTGYYRPDENTFFTPLHVSECGFKMNSSKINRGNRKTQIKSEFRLQNAGYCKVLLT